MHGFAKAIYVQKHQIKRELLFASGWLLFIVGCYFLLMFIGIGDVYSNKIRNENGYVLIVHAVANTITYIEISYEVRGQYLFVYIVSQNKILDTVDVPVSLWRHQMETFSA